MAQRPNYRELVRAMGNPSTPKNAQKLQKSVARESDGRSVVEAFEHTIAHRAPNKPPNLGCHVWWGF
jgi:hypothetical protein